MPTVYETAEWKALSAQMLNDQIDSKREFDKEWRAARGNAGLQSIAYRNRGDRENVLWAAFSATRRQMERNFETA